MIPAMLDEMAAVPLPLPVVVETGPQVGYDPDIQLSGRDIEVGVMDTNQDIQVLPDVFPAMFDETAAVPLPLPVVVETGPQVGYDPDILVSGWDIEVGVMDIAPDIPVLSDVFQALFDETAAVPLPLPVVIETEPQVGYDPVILLSGRDIEVGVANITLEIRVLPDVLPAMLDETAAVPLSSPVVADTRPQVDISND